MEDSSKEKPIDLAEKYNQIECVEFLKNIRHFQENEADDARSDEES